MPAKDRKTLKQYFEQGKKPSQQAFDDLIDSSLNTMDDGFIGSPTIGMGLTPINDDGVIISAFTNNTGKDDDKSLHWQVALNRDSGNLEIRRCKEGNIAPAMIIKHEISKSESKKSTGHETQFNGLINYQGRKGSYITGEVPADGRWHDMLGERSDLQDGCWAFEIVAGCGDPNCGRHALLVATAIHCFGSRPQIKKTRSNYGLWGNRLCLRWVKMEGVFTCQLQIKTFFKYNEGTNIKFQIAKLWDNPLME
ncbi:hypothetical protein GGR21_002531 [Dysgonomonas hofstadii]|uniref:Uncharacterized protein n=1 Tax=Dysgonomonas hofstadii TaxID=637886 RepID=A0A840CUW1_9BACT|nr:hypothetical protein [Dysgonomonas hofstadii]MBB4036625.1 hypothetical protein [Dysgonomonas hofstadii]